MLYELFSWMCNSEETSVPHQERVTLPGFNSEHECGLKHRRQLIADLRSAKFGAAALAVSETAQRIKQHNAYMEFMAVCQQELSVHGEYGSFILALKYLLSLSANGEYSDENIAKINRVFLLLLKEEKEQALDFYRQNKRELEKFQQINFAVDLAIATDQTVKCLAQLVPQLSTEENALTLAPLFFLLIDETEKFAAAILWLSQRVSAERILQTNLLQKFMVYHAAFLDAEDNPVRQLYLLLKQFPGTKELIETAGHVPCEELGLGFKAYAITGDRPAPELLCPVEIPLPSLVLTATEENFNRLYRLFGFNLLKLAVEGYAKYRSEMWYRILFDFLNRDSEQLTECISFIALQAPTKLEILASLIRDEMVDALVKRHNGTVLHLLPYKPALLMQLSDCDIPSYLEQICSEGPPVFEIVSQLMALFIAFRRINKPAAVLVYEAVLDMTLDHLELLEDGGLMRSLRKFSEKYNIIEKRSRQLQAQFNQCLDEQVLSGLLNTNSYHILEDAWRNVSKQLNALNEIASIEHHCPRSKYAFQVHIAKAYFSKYPGHFNLDDFFQALEIAQVLSAEGVSEYEQLLIEILTAIDDDSIRTFIIHALEANEAVGRRWARREYDGENVFGRAVNQDNAGLVKWLDASMRLNRATVDSMVLSAAGAARWKVVDYIYESHTLRQSIYKDILVLAAEGGQLKLVRSLCGGTITRLQGKDILQAFVRAAVNGHVDIMQFLWDFAPKAMGITMVAHAFKMAAQFQRLKSVEFLGNLVESPLLLRAVEGALMHAVTHNRVPVIQQICNLTYAPCLSVIEKAFLRATKSSNFSLARYLCSLPGVVLHQNIIDDGLDWAVKSKSLHAIAFMFDLKTCYPSQIATERALGRLVRLKRIDCVRLLCGLEKNRPRAQAIESALFLAIQSGAFPIMAYLSGVVRSSVIAKIFQWVAQYGSLDMLMYCFRHNPPNHIQIQSAHRVASSNKHGETRSYLQSLMPFASRRCAELSQSSMVPVVGGSTSAIRKRASCSDLEQYSFFGSQDGRRRHASASDSSALVSPSRVI